MEAKNKIGEFIQFDANYRFADIPKEAGVYALYCEANGKYYIGMSRVSIRGRLYRHMQCLKFNRHKNRQLQSCFNKYGLHAVCIMVTEESMAAEWEKRLVSVFDSFKNGFNETTGGECSSPSDEVKRRVSQKLKGKKRPKFSDEWRSKMSRSQKQRTQPESVKLKISQSMKGRVITWGDKISASKKAKFANQEGGDE